MIRPILQELRSLDAGPKPLRRFAWLVGGLLVALGTWLAWREAGGVGVERLAAALTALVRGDSAGAAVPGVLGALLLAVGAIRPRALRGPFLAWMALALAMGFVMTRVLLTVVYVGVLTPIALFLRLRRRDPMHRRPDPDVRSYWIPREPVEDRKAALERYW